MAPNKLENQIKEKLDSRAIQPSAQAWDRLDAMLSVAEAKKTKHPSGFLLIAACITILLSVGVFFFKQNTIEIKPQKEVVTNDTIQKEKNKFQIPIKEENHALVSETRSRNIGTQPVSIINQKQSKNPIINRDKQIEYQINQDIAVKDLPRLADQKALVATNDDTKKLDELLLAGLDNIAKQSTSKKAVVKVDAKNLLSQVDGELELTFREKVLKKVNKNYKEVKVALANRNNE